MFKILLSFVFFAGFLHAMTLDDLINSSLSKSPSLDVITARLEANKQSIKIAKQFSNPEMLLTRNTLDSSQAMHKTVISFKQKLPYFSKRDKREEVALAQEDILQEKLQSAKVMLVAKIKNEAYTIWELLALKKILNEYIHLTQTNVELYEAYVSTTANQHMGIMKAELSLSQLKIERSSLNSQINVSYARLSYLSAVDIQNLEIELEMGSKPDFQLLAHSLSNNPTIAIKDKELIKANKRVNLADINRYPDFNLLAGYAYRENFDNYFNFGVGLSLPIYGTEEAKKEIERATALSISSAKNDTKIAINSELQAYFAQMLSAYEIYHIVQDDALPQVEHMFEISNSSISTGSDLFKYIDVLFQKLSLEKKSIYAVGNYNRAEAKIAQLQGETK